MSEEIISKTEFIFRKNKAVSIERKRFEVQLNDLYEIVFEAKANFDIWWIMVSKGNREKYFHEMLFFKDFIEVVSRAALTNVIISSYKLYDTSRDKVHIRNLIKEAKMLKILKTDSDFNDFNPLLEQTEPIWKKISILRSKYFAHKVRYLNKTKIYKEANITPNQIKKYIELNLDILNRLSLKMKKKKKLFDNYVTKNAIELLDVLFQCKLRRKISS